MGKLIVFWIVLTAIIYAVKYVLNKDEKLTLRQIFIKSTYAGIYGVIIVVVLYQLNNISGV